MIDFMQFLLAVFIVHFFHFLKDLFGGPQISIIIEKRFKYLRILTEALKLVIMDINLDVELIGSFDISNGVNLFGKELDVELTAVHEYGSIHGSYS